MLKVLNREKAIKIADTMIKNKKLKVYDPFMSSIDTAVQKGVLIRLDNNNFILVKTKRKDVTWFMDFVISFPEHFIDNCDIKYKYKYAEHVIDCPEDYHGERERSGVFNIVDGKIIKKKISASRKKENWEIENKTAKKK